MTLIACSAPAKIFQVSVIRRPRNWNNLIPRHSFQGEACKHFSVVDVQVPAAARASGLGGEGFTRHTVLSLTYRTRRACDLAVT